MCIRLAQITSMLKKFALNPQFSSSWGQEESVCQFSGQSDNFCANNDVCRSFPNQNSYFWSFFHQYHENGNIFRLDSHQYRNLSSNNELLDIFNNWVFFSFLFETFFRIFWDENWENEHKRIPLKIYFPPIEMIRVKDLGPI